MQFDYATQGKQNGFASLSAFEVLQSWRPSLAHTYKSAVIEIEGKKLLYGEPIIYSIGSLKKSKNQTTAQAFIQYVTGNEGQHIIKRKN